MTDFLREERLLIDGELVLTYSEVAAHADALARDLRSRGIRPGDRVAALLPNSHYFLSAYFAAAAVGAVLCPLNHRLAEGELDFILRDSGARLVLRPAVQAGATGSTATTRSRKRFAPASMWSPRTRP